MARFVSLVLIVLLGVVLSTSFCCIPNLCVI